MNFLNLGLGELLGLIGVISAGVVALYLLDKSKKRLTVATLRFWTPATSRTDLKHRRKIQQPLSLLLQLLSLILLLTAIAGPQFGIFDGPGRDHVLVLDTSAWMGASVPGRPGVTLMDLARANAIGWLRAVPPTDRVLVVRADGLATSATQASPRLSTVSAETGRDRAAATAPTMAATVSSAPAISATKLRT